jgi:hypothetical protein
MGDPSFLYPNTFTNDRLIIISASFQKVTLYYSSSNFKTEVLGPGWAWDDYDSIAIQQSEQDFPCMET